jgi:hypothetical protein
VTAHMATGAGKGRSARQSWGFSKLPHSHWSELNNRKIEKNYYCFDGDEQPANSKQMTIIDCNELPANSKQMAGNKAVQ